MRSDLDVCLFLVFEVELVDSLLWRDGQDHHGLSVPACERGLGERGLLNMGMRRTHDFIPSTAVDRHMYVQWRQAKPVERRQYHRRERERQRERETERERERDRERERETERERDRERERERQRSRERP